MNRALHFDCMLTMCRTSSPCPLSTVKVFRGQSGMRKQTVAKVNPVSVSGTEVEGRKTLWHWRKERERGEAVQGTAGGVTAGGGGRLFFRPISSRRIRIATWYGPVVTRCGLLLSCGCYFTCLGSSLCTVNPLSTGPNRFAHGMITAQILAFLWSVPSSQSDLIRVNMR